MDVTALCIRLLLDVLVLLVARVHNSYFAEKADAAFLRIDPDRLQFFEYETISVLCEETDGFTGWRLMTKLNKITPTNSSNCDTSTPSCTIYPTFARHSGEYWCEDEKGERSDAINISVTAGSVILESPVRPVLEGDDVILHCIKKRTQSKHIADFYKDGSHLGTWYMVNMTIQNVSKSDEGLYKCSISGAGESPESWLKIAKQTPYEKTTDSPSSPSSRSLNLLTLLWIIVSVSLVALLLLVVVGILLWRKHRVFVCFSSEKSTPGSHSGSDNAADPDNLTYAIVIRKEREPKVSRAGTNQRLQEESVVYSSVTYRSKEEVENAG